MRSFLASLVLSTFVTLKSVAVGQLAPSFVLKDHDNNERTLADYRGKFIVLYFFPKSETYGCTKQACSLRDGFSDLQNAGVEILGVSYDSPETLKKFKEHHKLPFTLLSDSSKKAAKAYGAQMKFLWIFPMPVPARKTFIIDPEGMIIASMSDINVKHHAQQVLQIINQHKGS